MNQNSGMPTSTAMSQTTGSQSSTPNQGSMMNRGTPAESGRTWNGTDPNTSGTADRTGTSSANAAGSDMNNTAAGSRDMNRGTASSASRGRATNSTDSNTSGAADRSGTSTASDMNRTTTASDMNRTTTASNSGYGSRDRNSSNTGASSDMNRTTGAMDRSDSRGSSDIARNNTTPNEMSQTTGSAGSARGTDTQSGNNNWNSTGDVANSNNAGKWDHSCFISPASTSFAVQTQDGRTVKIDDAGNSKISSQLQSTGRVNSSSKIFRVKVTGSMNGDTLQLTDITM